MSVTLTASVPQAALDLAGDVVSMTSPAWARGALRIPSVRSESTEEPPLKRRRVSEEELWRQNLKICMQEQVVPHIDQAVAQLSPQTYKVDEIAVQAVAELIRSPSFHAQLDQGGGRALLPKHEADTKLRAVQVVQKLAQLPIYQNVITPIEKSTSDTDGSKLDISPSDDKQEPELFVPPSSSHTESLSDLFLAKQAHRRKRLKPRLRVPDSHVPSKWFNLVRRPYLTQADRDSIVRGVSQPIQLPRNIIQETTVYHVDFTQDEMLKILNTMKQYSYAAAEYTVDDLWRFCVEYPVPSMIGDDLPGRTVEDIRNFCSDILAKEAVPIDGKRVLSMQRVSHSQLVEDQRDSRLSSLLLAREMNGNAGFGRLRRYENFQNEFCKISEDDMHIIAEFTNCAGDISTVSWVPKDNVICGTTAHSDTHNQQYNKPGNLLLCSTSLGTLRAFSDHRIPRPIVAKGENSTYAMRQSQDPWLYSSVVASDYDAVHRRAFTSSFDGTVKVWKISEAGDVMTAVATWNLGGNVNFVAAAKDGSGRVAVAADLPTDAVRIYTVNEDEMSVDESSFQAFSCSRSDADGSDRWAYYPATMQWGKAPGTQHILVVGYSPRTRTDDENDIPEEKRNSGEIMLWDAIHDCKIPVMTASTANVFEVAWHPTIARFIVATTPCGLNIKTGVRTQIRVFQLDREKEDVAYTEYKSLDCPASDINELTIMPNSLLHAYVTAGCTDGKTYVWDTAGNDSPIHVLKHDYPLDDYREDREKEDTGIKFTAWGITADRFYTGSSDGVVKVWNVRNRHKPFVRNLLEAPGPISCGAFSPDCSKLVIGDATGRVFLLSVDKRDEPETHFKAVPGTNRRVRRPQPFAPHPEPPLPDQHLDAIDTEDNGDERSEDGPIGAFARRRYLASGQLVIKANPVIGAVQGPEYAATGLFRREAHLNEDPASPLMTVYERHQREAIDASIGSRRRSMWRLKPYLAGAADADTWQRLHVDNKSRDLVPDSVEDVDIAELVRAGRELAINGEDWGFEYEEDPASDEADES